MAFAGVAATCYLKALGRPCYNSRRPLRFARRCSSTHREALILCDPPGGRWTALSATLAASTQSICFQPSGSMSDMVSVFSIHGFQMTVLSEPDFSTTMRRFHAGSCTMQGPLVLTYTCLLYTSDAGDDLLCVDLGGRR